VEIQPENLNYVGCQIRGHSSTILNVGCLCKVRSKVPHNKCSLCAIGFFRKYVLKRGNITLYLVNICPMVHILKCKESHLAILITSTIM